MRILLVLDQGAYRNDEAVLKFAAFLSKQKGVELRMISTDRLKRVCRMNSINDDQIDFGIYGPEMLFRTTATQPTHEGVYSKNRALVDRYRRLFDQCWFSDGFSESIIIPEGIGRNLSFYDVRELRLEEKAHAVPALPAR